MTLALITLSPEGARLLAPLVGRLPDARLWLHESVPWPPEAAPVPARDEAPGEHPERSGSAAAKRGKPVKDPDSATLGGAPAAERFAKIADLTAALFGGCRGLVYAAPCGVVVRAIAPLLRSKYADPAVVVLDAGGRWAVSLLSGHEGGANDLAFAVANLTGAEPVITTTTEALKNVIVGIGCRRGTPAERIVAAIRETLAECGVDLAEVRLIASADLKADEAGLLAAAATLALPLRFLSGQEIRAAARPFTRSAFVQEKVNLPAVAEPAALLAGRRTQLICPKKTFKGITVTLARESFSSSG